MTPPETYDLTDIRVEQATMLKQRVVASCVFVQFLICNYSIILLATGEQTGILLWFFLSTAMVAVTYFYAKIVAKSGITRANVNGYLAGHIMVSSITGIIWGGFAIYISSGMEPMDLLVSVFLVCGITIGGMLPSSAYRPGYMGLATFALAPFALFILLTAPWPMILMGLAILVYFAFGIITSARAEKDLFDSIERRNAHAQAERLKAENLVIQRVNEEKTRFLAATSHDLSQPLHAQGYFIQSLREKLNEPSTIELLDKIEQTWQRQGQFLRGLVDINRLNSGAIKPNIGSISLAGEMQAIADEFSGIADEKDITLTCTFEDSVTQTDAVLLNRIVRNVISNAIKYTPRGGNVSFKLTNNKGMPEIVVSDNGHGIPTDQLENIFEEYVQLGKNDTNENGVGLGLSIVRKLAELLAIKMDVQSIVGKGTVFKICLPDIVDQIAVDEKTNTAESYQTQLNSSPMVVLVDDDRIIRESMSNLLTSWGCQLITASTSDEAVELLNNIAETPSLLIADKWLENGASGIDLITQLREEVNDDIPAILMSGDPSGLNNKEPMTDVTFLIKPVAPEEIYKRLQDATAMHVKT
ncbi:ATP-binding protein [Kordiimonas aquimaris]|uniref:ATP-binding protein n=1 Tax=Kordiimonas aquimaris TaxID=707591 RepID=UPI0021D20619|nr:ATP-binding protein [Kordiimonas aquimaris]